MQPQEIIFIVSTSKPARTLRIFCFLGLICFLSSVFYFSFPQSFFLLFNRNSARSRKCIYIYLYVKLINYCSCLLNSILFFYSLRFVSFFLYLLYLILLYPLSIFKICISTKYMPSRIQLPLLYLFIRCTRLLLLIYSIDLFPHLFSYLDLTPTSYHNSTEIPVYFNFYYQLCTAFKLIA